MRISNLTKYCQYTVNRLGSIWIYMAAAALLALPSVSMACSYSFHVTSVSSLDVDPSLPIGSPIGSAQASFPELPFNGCVGQGQGQIVGIGTPVGKVYPTTIQGVGYRAIILSNWAPPLSIDYWPTGTVGGPLTTWFSGGFPAGTLKIEFIKTGVIPAKGGTFGPTPIGYLMVGGYIGATFNLDAPMVVNPVTNACTITQSAITVNLDDVRAGQINVPGSTANEKLVNIPLSCSLPAAISLAFSGTVTDSTNAVFTNSNSGNASSVGIQLLDQYNNPVPTLAGQYVSLGTVNGTLNYPMTARYYSLRSNVDAGVVNTVINVAIVYN